MGLQSKCRLVSPNRGDFPLNHHSLLKLVDDSKIHFTTEDVRGKIDYCPHNPRGSFFSLRQWIRNIKLVT